MLPARQIWRTQVVQVIRGGAVGEGIFRRFTVRDALLTVQIALCTLLVTASLVAVRGMQRSRHAVLGIQPQGAILADFDLRMAGDSAETSPQVEKRMIDKAAQIPGVTAVGAISYIPLNFGAGSTPVYASGTADLRPSKSVLSVKFFSTSPGYLSAAGTQLLAGRDFTWRDDGTSPKVVLVNETFARRMFGNSTAIGKRFLVWGTDPYQIVGVVQNGKYDSLTENPQPAMFFPLAQSVSSHAVLVVRSRLAPAEATAALHAVLTGIEPSLPFTIQSWSDALGLVLFPAQAATGALGIMGLLAAMLAVTGIFGMAAYSVSKRMKELGIRIALGAQPAQLMRSALGRPLVLLLSGSVAGLVLGVLASRLLAQIVYEATPRDPVVMGGVVVTMALLGLLATWIPARRALHIDPNQLLHES
jgi:predicted permease